MLFVSANGFTLLVSGLPDISPLNKRLCEERDRKRSARALQLRRRMSLKQVCNDDRQASEKGKSGVKASGYIEKEMHRNPL